MHHHEPVHARAHAHTLLHIRNRTAPNPLAGATVSVSRAGRSPISVTTDSHGQYHVWLAPGALTTAVSDDGHAGAARNVTARQGRDTRADFALSTA
ncbi:carboxypeptidase-like regulatory domain-containing protein [Streptomyces sp. NPDC001156]